jgi:hypothetical protein
VAGAAGGRGCLLLAAGSGCWLCLLQAAGCWLLWLVRCSPSGRDGIADRVPTDLDDDYTHDIFLSHLQRNAQNTVIAMNLFLRDAAPGVRTFIDLEVNMNKKGGLQNALRNGVRRSRALLFFITDGIFKSEWCCQELRWAREMGRTIILVNETDARHGGTYPRVSPTRIATRIATRHTPHATRPALIACAGGAALCACCRHRHEGGNQAGARRHQVSAARQGT